MPFSFDFRNTGTNAPGNVTSVNTNILNTADNVTFSMSTNSAASFQQIRFLNENTALGLDAGSTAILIDDQNDGFEDFELRFTGTSPAGNNRITGVSGSPIILNFGNISGTWQIRLTTVGFGTVALGSVTSGDTAISGIASAVTAITFTPSGGGGLNSLAINTLSGSSFTCFCAGTRVETVDGFKEVQDLEPGDCLRLADGGTTEVRWLGQQSVSKTFADPARANPICITAGTLGNTQDLFVSPDHGIAIDGHLINASALVNGETIYQVAEMQGDFTYYHVETEAHELILAEGIATESYVDLPSRAVFDNGHERADEAPIQPMEMPRISSRRMLPPHILAQTARSRVA